MFPCDPCEATHLCYLLNFKGNTGLTSFKDCNNDCNGTARNASCGVCLQQGAVNQFLDCNNDCHGNASVDDCGVCTGGNTGLVANYLKDECSTFLHFCFKLALLLISRRIGNVCSSEVLVVLLQTTRQFITRMILSISTNRG